MNSLYTKRWFARLATANLIYCVVVILWGAFVRATGSGAGCGAHWPLCNGELIPQSPVLETVIELAHRLTSGVFLLLAALQLLVSFKIFPKGHPCRRWTQISFGLLVFEALIGASLVLLELVAQNSSVARAFAVGGHLVNTMILLASLTITQWLVKFEALPKSLFTGPVFKKVALSFVLLLALGASGAVVALGDTLFPAQSIKAGLLMDIDPNSSFLIKLRVWHPLLAVLSSFYILFVGNWAMNKLSRGMGLIQARMMIAAILMQLAIGTLNLFLLVPVWTQMLHLLMANVLWIVCLRFWLFATLDFETVHSPSVKMNLNIEKVFEK